MRESSNISFGRYAQIYDALHQDKDYRAEAKFVLGLIRRLKPKSSTETQVIDLACGTGRHAIELADMGCKVTGSDISEEMIAIARESAASRGAGIPFHVQSLQNCNRIGGAHDAAIAMFASLGYLTTPGGIAAALSAIRELLAPGGLFIFDVWNGLAVLRDYSPLRVKRVPGPSAEVLRISRTSLDEIQQVATIQFEFIVLHKNDAPAEFSEKHIVRFFFPREMEEILTANGFRLLLRCPFLDASRALEPYDWNVTFVAQKA